MVLLSAGKVLVFVEVLGSGKVCCVVGSCVPSGGVVVNLVLIGTWSLIISCGVKLSSESSLTKIFVFPCMQIKSVR